MTSVVCFANRQLGARIVSDLVQRDDIHLVAVVTNDGPNIDLPIDASLVQVPVLSWSEYVTSEGSSLCADRGLSVLFRHRVPARILDTFAAGVVNLHPSLLPFGRGSHPATWAIWEGTRFGATAHFMTEDIDAGPILAQEEIAVEPTDTSYGLYAKGLEALWRLYETDVIAWLLGTPAEKQPQMAGGSQHTSADLRQLKDLDEAFLPNQLRDRLARALAIDRQAPSKWPENRRRAASTG